ncbi:hypothetical protein pipiens_003572 [Culex pipiens pipiens]|uniref:Uncharacterized protein n=1 Tax=Culex pipiens pipiens TaxID=38569 RepID=A0ABD1CVN4_CULPP
MFAAIPFPCAQPKTTPEGPGPSLNKPIVSLFGPRSTRESTTPTSDCTVPPRPNTPQASGEPVPTYGTPTPTLPDERQDPPAEKDDLTDRKLRLTVETLEKQSHLLSLQIWHYECQYGLPHSEFSRQFDFGGASPIPPDHGREQERRVETGSEANAAGEGTSGVKPQPATEVDDIVVKKEELMDESDDTVEEEEGLWTEERSSTPEKPPSEGLFGTVKPSEAVATSHETSFGSLFGPASTSVSFGSANIFGGNFQTNPKPSTTATLNFRLPQVSATGKSCAVEETSQLSRRQLELAVETMQKQSHLLNLQILQYEFRHRIPHSKFSRRIALDAAMNGQQEKEVSLAVDSEPIDYTMACIENRYLSSTTCARNRFGRGERKHVPNLRRTSAGQSISVLPLTEAMAVALKVESACEPGPARMARGLEVVFRSGDLFRLFFCCVFFLKESYAQQVVKTRKWARA